jgi:hypothetical protein
MPLHDSGPSSNQHRRPAANDSRIGQRVQPSCKFKIRAHLNRRGWTNRAALSAARAVVSGEVGGWRWGVSDPGFRPRPSPRGPRRGRLRPTVCAHSVRKNVSESVSGSPPDSVHDFPEALGREFRMFRVSSTLCV